MEKAFKIPTYTIIQSAFYISKPLGTINCTANQSFLSIIITEGRFAVQFIVLSGLCKRIYEVIVSPKMPTKGQHKSNVIIMKL